MLVSNVQQSNSVIHIHTHIFFFRFFYIIGYYKILSIVPCAIQYVLVVYPTPLVTISLFSMSVSIFVL